MTANHPSKELVRAVMAQHRAEGAAPLTPEQFRQQLGWKLIQDSKRGAP